jgi:hypothetical protein
MLIEKCPVESLQTNQQGIIGNVFDFLCVLCGKKLAAIGSIEKTRKTKPAVFHLAAAILSVRSLGKDGSGRRYFRKY